MSLGTIVLGGVAGYVLHATLHLRRRPLRSVAEPPSGVTVLGPRRRPYDQEVEQ